MANKWLVAGTTVYTLTPDPRSRKAVESNEFTIQVSQRFDVEQGQAELLAQGIADLLNEAETRHAMWGI